MKLKRRIRHFVIFAAVILVLGYLGIQFGYPLYRELTYYASDRTDAEQAVMAFAREHDIPYSAYPESLIELLERNPETEDYVLEYPLEGSKEQHIDLTEYENSKSVPLFLQWDQRWGYMQYGDDLAGLTACGPVCLSMAAYYLTGSDSFSPDKMITFAEKNGYYSHGNGSSWTLISEGAVRLGFDVTEIPLDENRIFKNLEVDNPIICAMGPGDFTTTGHFIVMTGYENGMIRINDPNSTANSQRLWSFDEIQGQIRNLWVIRNG